MTLLKRWPVDKIWVRICQIQLCGGQQVFPPGITLRPLLDATALLFVFIVFYAIRRK